MWPAAARDLMSILPDSIDTLVFQDVGSDLVSSCLEQLQKIETRSCAINLQLGNIPKIFPRHRDEFLQILKTMSTILKINFGDFGSPSHYDHTWIYKISMCLHALVENPQFKLGKMMIFVGSQRITTIEKSQYELIKKLKHLFPEPIPPTQHAVNLSQAQAAIFHQVPLHASADATSQPSEEKSSQTLKRQNVADEKSPQASKRQKVEVVEDKKSDEWLQFLC